MTDQYPPFALDQGGHEESLDPAGPAHASAVPPAPLP
jgi:hypothetical protein